MYLRDAAVPDEKKEFQYIKLIGFVTDFAKLICKVYKLVMDFYNSKSTLYSGEQELELNDALNRLILTLEQMKNNLGLTPFHKLRHEMAGVENDPAIDRSLVFTAKMLPEILVAKKVYKNGAKCGACMNAVCKVGITIK